VALVPVKAFSSAKRRLAPVLDPSERELLARTMAEHVLEAAAPLVVAVVCDDEEVASWAVEHGALLLEEPGLGLNGAVTAGVEALAAAGADEVLVVHADLPLATGLAKLAGAGGVTLVPDRREDGTNIACVPSRAGFHFSYGPASFKRHCTEAERIGLELHIVREPLLAWDVDVPDDIPAGFTHRWRP
jgi:2-phospho-L-lactate guanylyltransferase